MNVRPKGIPEGDDCCSPWNRIMERIRAITTELSTTVKRVTVNGQTIEPVNNGQIILPDYPEPVDPIEVDDRLDTTSTNPVQNKVIAVEVDSLDARMESVEDDIPTLEQAVAGIVTDITDDIKPDIEDLENDLQTAQNDIIDLQDDITRIDGDVDVLEADVDALEADVAGLETDKQDKLTAGTNITIDENNVISVSGGGGGGDVLVKYYTADGTSSSATITDAEGTTYTWETFRQHLIGNDTAEYPILRLIGYNNVFLYMGHSGNTITFKSQLTNSGYYYLECTFTSASTTSVNIPTTYINSYTDRTSRQGSFNANYNLISISTSQSCLLFVTVSSELYGLIRQGKAKVMKETYDGTTVYIRTTEPITLTNNNWITWTRHDPNYKTTFAGEFGKNGTVVYVIDADADKEAFVCFPAEIDFDNLQPKLTAGTNITIVDNVISATGGGEEPVCYYFTGTNMYADADHTTEITALAFNGIMADAYENNTGFYILFQLSYQSSTPQRIWVGSLQKTTGTNPTYSFWAFSQSTMERWRFYTTSYGADDYRYNFQRDSLPGTEALKNISESTVIRTKTYTVGSNILSLSLYGVTEIFIGVNASFMPLLKKCHFEMSNSGTFYMKVDEEFTTTEQFWLNYMLIRDYTSNSKFGNRFMKVHVYNQETPYADAVECIIHDDAVKVDLNDLQPKIRTVGFETSSDLISAMQNANRGDQLGIERMTVDGNPVFGFVGAKGEYDEFDQRHVFSGCGVIMANGTPEMIYSIVYDESLEEIAVNTPTSTISASAVTNVKGTVRSV